ncbi:MAG: tetratricopeptide repeat protein [Chloroflexi bacterium]|nr:tetratricopeptide repeat protein [Chloroflexota bacterium]
MAELAPLEAAVTSATDLPLRRLGRPVGRDELLRALLLRLRQSQQLILHGAAGAGKTTLAATIASVYLQQHDRPVLWLNVDDPPLVELVVRIARAYGDTDSSNDENPLTRMAAVKTLLSERKPLLALDGQIDSQVLAAFVRRCAADIPLVVTSPAPLPEGDWRNQPVGNLAESDAVRLFKQKAGIKDNSQDVAIQVIAAQLKQAAFPLALSARSMIIARQSPTNFSDTLAAALESHDDQPALAALSISFDGLNERLRDLLLFLCATLRGEASVAFLNLLSGIAAESIDMSMTILSRLFLVERFQRLGEACYRLHPLAHEFLKDWALERDRFDGLRADIVDATRDYLDVRAKTDDAIMRLVIEMEGLIATAAWAAQNENQELAADILETLTPLAGQLAAEGYQYELTRLRAIRDGEELAFELPPEEEPALAPDPESIGEAVAQSEPVVEDVLILLEEDDDDEPPLLDDEEETLVRAADDEEPAPAIAIDDSTYIAIDDKDLQSVNIDQLRTALNVASQNNETSRQLQILKAIARMQINQGREKEAIATYGGVLEIYENSEDKDGVLETLDMLAGLLVANQSTPAAIEQVKLRTALSFARQHEDTPRVLQILEAVGKVQIDQNRADEAVATYNEVLAIHENDENKAGILQSLDMLAGLLVRSDSAVSALAHVQRGLHLADELDDGEAEMFLQITRGDAHKELGEASIAVEAYEAALRNARHRDDMQNEALILYKLGLAYLDAGESRRAIEMLEDANDRFKRQGKRDMEGEVLRGLGEVNVALERWSEAVNFHSSALYIARETGDRALEAQQLRHLGQILIKADKLPEALTRLRQALHVAYEEQNRDDIVGIIADLVSLMMRNLFLSSIAELLINDGLAYDAENRELLLLKKEVGAAKERAAGRGIALAVVAGSARDYAANAYNYS